MVRVDSTLCCYCGSCVSLCPFGALVLDETRLTVSDSCTECGECIPACPVSALAADAGIATYPFTSKIGSDYDVIVVGAGPAGSIAAHTAAALGLSVLLLEKRQEIGSPVRCAEGVSRTPLLEFVDPDASWISALVNRARITAVGQGSSDTMSAEGGDGYILERRVFDRMLAERAAAEGATVAVKSPATGLLRDGEAVRGVIVGHGPEARQVGAQVVIAADGVESLVGRWAGLDTALPPSELMTCAQYLLAGIDIDPACCAYTIDENVAPGGYAWVFPKGPSRANVGLGMQASLAANRESAIRLLDRFVESDHKLAIGSPVTLVCGGVPVSEPLGRPFTGGMMVVGDAARQVDPLTGGGIISGMLAGRQAAQVAAKCIAQDDLSAEALSEYARTWHAGPGRKARRSYRWRQRFPPGQRASKQFVRAFAAAVSGM